MRVVYQSAYFDEELSSGDIIRTIPGNGALCVKPDKNDSNVEYIYNGELHEECDAFPADDETELIIKNGNNIDTYKVIPFIKPLGLPFTQAYVKFSHEFETKTDNEIDSILSGNVKLYAIDQSTEVKNWTELFDLIDSSFKALKFICDNPKSHLKAVNEVRPIETVKRVGYESIPYLASHSEDWLARTASGLKPARLFSRVEDDEYHIYENRVVKTLIDIIISFLRKINRDLKEKYSQLEGIINSGVQTGSFGFDVVFKKAVAELIKTDVTEDNVRTEAMCLAEKLERESKRLLKRYLDLKNSRLYRLLNRSKNVSNPLNETNILLMDKHYSVAYKLWKSIHKVLIANNTAELKKSTCSEDYLNYKQFCKTLVGYAAHVMNFVIESDGEYKRYDDIDITVYDNQDIIEIVVEDVTEHEVIIPNGVMVPIEAGHSYNGFRFDGKKLYWSYKTTMDDIEEFTGLLKPKGKGGKEQNEQKRYYTELKRIIGDKEHEYPESKKIKVVIVPCMVDIKPETRNAFKEYIEDVCENIRRNHKADYIVVALPKCQDDEQSLVGYALNDDERLLVLPLSMFDINSFRRIQNVLIRMILKLEKNTCPCCGEEMRKDETQMICDYCSGLIITTTTCPEKDCRHSYKYLGYKVSEDTIRKMQDVDRTNFFHVDSLYQYKNIVPMKISNGKLITVCPHCGR